MIEGGIGGGNTRTGLIYEAKVDLKDFLCQQRDYFVSGNNIYYQGQEVGQMFKKHDLYSKFLKPRGIDWRNNISAKLLPDNGIMLLSNITPLI